MGKKKNNKKLAPVKTSELEPSTIPSEEVTEVPTTSPTDPAPMTTNDVADPHETSNSDGAATEALGESETNGESEASELPEVASRDVDKEMVTPAEEHEGTTMESEPERSTEPVEASDPQPNTDTKSNPLETEAAATTKDPSPSPEPTATSEPTPTPAPAAPAPKKRLTLQERLALAAKTKKSSKRSASSPVTSQGEFQKKTVALESRGTSEAPTRSTTPTIPEASTSTANGSTVQTRSSSLDLQREPAPQPQALFPSNFKELSTEELHKLITDAQNKFIALESKNRTLSEEKHSLQEKVKTLQSESTIKVATTSSASDQLLREKDSRIAQLLKEGEELSKKELKFNNTIKRLKAKESDNEYEISELMKKVENLESERKTLKESLKRATESDQMNSNKSKSLQKQLESEKDALKEEIARTEQLSAKIEELSQTLVEEKNRFSKKINDLKRQVEKEKQKQALAKEEHLAEVGRLESKIEQLRFQAENAQTTTSGNDEGYLKLIKQYDILQTQYTSATENWQSIEASLMGKISKLEEETTSLDSKLKNAEQKVTVLSKDLAEKVSELDKLSGMYHALTAEHSKLKTKLATVTKTLEETEESLSMKEVTYSQEKSSLEYKVRDLERQVKEASMIQPQHLSVDTNMSYISSYSRNTSTPSFKQRPWDGSRENIALGESSTTPLQSRKASAAFLTADNFYEERNDSLSDFGENDTIDSPVSNFNTWRVDNHSSINVGGSSVQLIGKMSSQVRRLQTEMSAMKEELDKLNEDKKTANEEIVKLMKDNEKVNEYKQRIAQLEEEVEGYSSRHDKMLEILGEKSEQVEELKADVQDLKDLCKLQVQQMVELQSK